MKTVAAGIGAASAVQRSGPWHTRQQCCSQRCHMLSSARITSLLSTALLTPECVWLVCILITDSLEAVPCGAVQVQESLGTPLLRRLGLVQHAGRHQHRRHQAGRCVGLRSVQLAAEAGSLQQGTDLRGEQGQACQRRVVSLTIHPAQLQHITRQNGSRLQMCSTHSTSQSSGRRSAAGLVMQSAPC